MTVPTVIMCYLCPIVCLRIKGNKSFRRILIFSYILRWLLATATNARGTIMETTMINMSEFNVPENLTGMPPSFNER